MEDIPIDETSGRVIQTVAPLCPNLIITVILTEDQAPVKHEVVLNYQVLHLLLDFRAKLLATRLSGPTSYKKKFELELFKNEKVRQYLDSFVHHVTGQCQDSACPGVMECENRALCAKIANEIIDRLQWYLNPPLLWKTRQDLSGHAQSCQICKERDRKDEHHFDSMDGQSLSGSSIERFEASRLRIDSEINAKYRK